MRAMSPANTVLRLESTVNNEDATDNQQTVANQEATALQGAVSSQVSVASQMAIASDRYRSVATLPRKRGTPNGSKNKRKQDQTAVDKPTSKRARKPGTGSKHRRSLDTAMIVETVQLAPTDSTESTTVATTHPGTVANQPAAIECQVPATPTPAHTSVPLQPQSADSSAVAARQIATADVARGNNSQPITTPPPSHSSRRITSGQSPSITALYVNTLVAFAPAKERWVTSKKYVGVDNAFIIGRVCRVVKGLYQVMWVDSQFQSNVENLTLSMVQRGNTNYSALHGHATGPGWGSLCAVDLGEPITFPSPAPISTNLSRSSIGSSRNRMETPPGRISPTLWWIERPSYPRTVSLEKSAKISTTARSAEVGDSGDARDVCGATSNASSDSGSKPSGACAAVIG
ncbi:hypothetical protein GQ600_25012 [Phytophthora cactorum]|nr:hypothetical protein GQ600_25012 [Phytophthora cactorum]